MSVAVGHSDFDTAPLRDGDLVADRDRHVAPGFDLAVQPRVDGRLSRHHSDVRVGASVAAILRERDAREQKPDRNGQCQQNPFGHSRVSPASDEERSLCHAAALRGGQEYALNKGLMNHDEGHSSSALSHRGDIRPGFEDTRLS